MSWTDLVNKDELKQLPPGTSLLSDNGISMVYIGGDQMIYKRSIPYFIHNEMAFLHKLKNTGYVPQYERYDKYTLQLENFGLSQEITDIEAFVQSCLAFMFVIGSIGIRHRDLTRPHIIVVDNKIKVIDWAESRWEHDPAPDKRAEGDEYWMDKTMKEMCGTGWSLYGE